jgi:hypothetical protein
MSRLQHQSSPRASLVVCWLVGMLLGGCRTPAASEAKSSTGAEADVDAAGVGGVGATEDAGGDQVDAGFDVGVETVDTVDETDDGDTSGDGGRSGDVTVAIDSLGDAGSSDAALDVAPDPCAGIDCDQHGTCYPLYDQPICQCEVGYYRVGATHCSPESTPGPCFPNPCKGPDMAQEQRGHTGRASIPSWDVHEWSGSWVREWGKRRTGMRGPVRQADSCLGCKPSTRKRLLSPSAGMIHAGRRARRAQPPPAAFARYIAASAACSSSSAVAP